MSEFKVGDLVRVVRWSDWNQEMPHEHVNRITDIDSVDPTAVYRVYVPSYGGSLWAVQVEHVDEEAATSEHAASAPGLLTPDFSRFAQALMLEARHSSAEAYMAALYLQERTKEN